MKTIRRAKNWVELEPMGVTTQVSATQPLMLFREKGGQAILSLIVHPLDAAVALAEMDQDIGSPHDLGLMLLAQAGCQLDRCLFLENQGQVNYVELRFKGEKKLKPCRVPTDLAMSFCLRSKVRFFCTRNFLDGHRDLHVDVKNHMHESALEQMPRPRYLN